MKRLFNIILLGFPVKLILWCIYNPFNLINPLYDAFFTCSLFLFWVIAMLHYDDIRVKKVYKRMNLVSFIMLVVFIFTSPFLVDLGEKFAAFQSRRIASSEKPQNLPGITIFSNKKQNVQ